MGLLLLALMGSALAAQDLQPIPALPLAAQRGQGRIVGGEVANDGEFPFQVSLRSVGAIGLTHFCGGSIVLGTPKPSLQWFKDDLEVFSSDRLEIKDEEDGGSVIVREARMNDSGNIKCVATNILGRATTVANLTIEASPRLELPENYNDGLIFRYDEVIRMKIPLIAKPPPRITWFFDDEPISASEDVQIEITETLTSLRIGAAKRWHCGEFRVLAQNENGEDSASILVTVTAPPSPPGQPVVIDITGTTCVLRWEPVQDDGGTDVKHYIVEYFRDVWDVWLKAKTTKECQVSIEDLIPGSRYKFRIKAENAYGISDESQESDPFDVNQPIAGAAVPPPPPADPRNPTISISTEDWSEAESGPVRSPPQKPSLAATKGEWESNEASEDVFKDLLRVKKLSQRVSSVESDGLPSMASVTDDNASILSESSDLQVFAYNGWIYLLGFLMESHKLQNQTQTL